MFLVPNVSSKVRCAGSFLEITQVFPWQDPTSEVLKCLSSSLSLSPLYLNQSFIPSLSSVSYPGQGGSVCGTEEADPRVKGAALLADSIQFNYTSLSLDATHATPRHWKRWSCSSPQNVQFTDQLWAQCSQFRNNNLPKYVSIGSGYAIKWTVYILDN